MIELTTLQLLGIIGTMLGFGFSAGLSVGFVFSKKTITTAEIHCNTPKDNKFGSIKALRIFSNGKATDINCFYLQENKICGYTNTKCKYL